jgi:SAM-dependent methyltransferase
MSYSSADIRNIYFKYYLPDSYFLKNNNVVPKEKIFPWKNEIDMHNMDYPRINIMLDFIEWVNKYNLKTPKKVLTTSINECELNFINPLETCYYIYNENTNEGDLHLLNINKKIDNVDFIIIGQTLEHVYNPSICLKNIFDTLIPGGYFFTSVPTYNIPHCIPYHYYHFTLMGLIMSMLQAGFEIVELGQWGNIDYINKLTAHSCWPGYYSLDKPIINDRNNPCQVWCLVRKPL